MFQFQAQKSGKAGVWGARGRGDTRVEGQDQLWWIITLCPSTDQSEGTAALKGHTWEVNEFCVEMSPGTFPEIPAFGKQIKPLKMEDPYWGPFLSLEHTRSFPTSPLLSPGVLPLPFLLLNSKSPPLFFLCNLFPEPTQRSWLTSFCLSDFLHKLSPLI